MKKMSVIAEIGFTFVTVTLLIGCSLESRENERGNAVILPTTGKLLSIAISPAASAAAACMPVPFTAMGNYSGESAPRDVTNLVQWGIDILDAGKGYASVSGVATGIVPGAVEVEAYSGAQYYASAVLNVTNIGALTLSISPLSASAVVGTSKKFTATASCGAETFDVSKWVTWSTNSSPAAATVTPDPLNNITPGTISAVATGNATISATLGGATATTNLTIQ